MALSPKSRLLAVPTIALMSLTVLAGCGSSDKKESAPSSSATSSSAASSSASADDSSSSASADDSSSSASEAPVAEASLPDGYKTVTAPKNAITFAVPEGWVEIDSKTLSNDDAIQQYLEEAAAGTSFTADQLKAQMAQMDLMATSITPNADGFTENINVLSAPVPTATLPNEEEAATMVQGINGQADKYKVVDTKLGPAAQQSYSATIAGVHVHGIYLIVPAASGNGYSILTVTSSNADGAQTIADNVLKTVQKAS